MTSYLREPENNNVVNYLLKLGYTPTRIADSFAIASGGASMYRNRIKSYMKEENIQDINDIVGIVE